MDQANRNNQITKTYNNNQTIQYINQTQPQNQNFGMYYYDLYNLDAQHSPLQQIYYEAYPSHQPTNQKITT